MAKKVFLTFSTSTRSNFFLMNLNIIRNSHIHLKILLQFNLSRKYFIFYFSKLLNNFLYLGKEENESPTWAPPFNIQPPRSGRALINPFDPSHITIRLTSNRRRWSHIFPKGMLYATLNKEEEEEH